MKNNNVCDYPCYKSRDIERSCQKATIRAVTTCISTISPHATSQSRGIQIGTQSQDSKGVTKDPAIAIWHSCKNHSSRSHPFSPL